MSAHTPGPWSTDATLPGRIYSADATGSIIATATGFMYAPRPPAEIEANARLIAAAPDLLAALKHLLVFAGDCGMARQEALAAIAKATRQ